MTAIQPTHNPPVPLWEALQPGRRPGGGQPDATVGTVMTDQRGMQWTCRAVQADRGPLFTPSHVTAEVPELVMASEEELAESGVLLTAVTA